MNDRSAAVARSVGIALNRTCATDSGVADSGDKTRTESLVTTAWAVAQVHDC